MRYCILPTLIDGRDEKGNAIKVNICPDTARKTIDGTQWICHEELMPKEYKSRVLKAVDLEDTVTKNSAIALSKVLVTKARAWMETSSWSVKNVEAINELQSL